MKKAIISFLLVAAVATALYFGLQARRRAERGGPEGSQSDARNLPPVSVTIKAGGEKSGFLKNPELLEYLDREHHLTLKSEKEGSVEMVRQPVVGFDGLWPASEYCRQEFEARAQREAIRFTSQDIFNSPLVVASWQPVAQVFREPGRSLVQLREGSYFVLDMDKLTKVMDKGTTWKEVGLPLHGRLTFKSTDPTKSNSGAMFAGLLANVMNAGDPCTLDKVDTIMPRLRSIFGLMGLKEVSSGDIFEHFLAQGVGSYPLVIAYENQFIEAISNANAPASLRTEVAIFYPEPTVWSSHPFIALTESGKRLQEALKDPYVQKLAWERHGFRSGAVGAMNDPEIFKTRGIPKQVLSTVPAPEYRVMDLITRALGATNP